MFTCDGSASLECSSCFACAYFIGVVLLTMMTGRLVQCKGSLARAALPFVLHLKWGWHRVERAMKRGHPLEGSCQ